MTLESEKESPSTVFGCDAEYLKLCACTSLDSDSGAGVNAGRISNTGLSGMDRLSELVWSPKKGLFLKCADGSSTTERPYATTHTTPIAIPSTKVDSCKNSNISCFPDIHSQGESSGGRVPVHCSTRSKRKFPLDLSHEYNEFGDCQIECMDITVGPSSATDVEYQGNDRQKGVTGAQISGNYPTSISFPRNEIMRKPRTGPSSTIKLEVPTVKKRKVSSDPGCCGFLFVERAGLPVRGKSCPLPPDIVLHRSSGEDPKRKDHIPADSDLPSTSRIQLYEVKSSHKASSHGNNSEKNSSNESVESCSREDLLSKLHLAEPSVILESKTLVNNIQSGHASSFMIWISNMVKGHPGFSSEKVPSLSRQPPLLLDKVSETSGFVTPLYNSQAAHLSEQPRMFELDGERIDVISNTVSNIACKRRRQCDSICNISDINEDVNLTLGAKERNKSVRIQDLTDSADEANQGIRSSWIACIKPTTSLKLSRNLDLSHGSRQFMYPKNHLPDFLEANKEQSGKNNLYDWSSQRLNDEGLPLKNETKVLVHDLFRTNLQVSSKMDDVRSEVETKQGSTKSISSQQEETFLHPENAAKCSQTLNNFIPAPLCNISRTFPKSIFDAIKSLQVSRSDILKWMHSQMPLSHLDGMFLRLRHTKGEARLFGTGYLVACINGEPTENLSSTPNVSVLVNLEGTNRLVECQYISNKHFLEDELIAWWSSTSQSEGEIPSHEQLLKLEKKRLLGI